MSYVESSRSFQVATRCRSLKIPWSFNINTDTINHAETIAQTVVFWILHRVALVQAKKEAFYMQSWKNLGLIKTQNGKGMYSICQVGGSGNCWNSDWEALAYSGCWRLEVSWTVTSPFHWPTVKHLKKRKRKKEVDIPSLAHGGKDGPGYLAICGAPPSGGIWALYSF